MAKQTYRRPEIPAGSVIADLVPEDANAAELTPETVVLCINRGRKPLVDMFDARNYTMPAGYFHAPYGAALHFQRRQIVPGTKNPNLAWAFKSWIGILGVDAPDACEPFTDEELETYGEQVEAIDRAALGENVTIVKTTTARASMEGQGLVGGMGTMVGNGGAPRTVVGVEADTPRGQEAAEHVMDRPPMTEAAQDTAAALADGWVPPADDGRTASVPVPRGEALAQGASEAATRQNRGNRR